MYSLVSAIAKPVGGDGRWKEVAIGDRPINQLFSTYVKVLATLSNSFIEGNVSLDFDDIQSDWGASNLTFNQFLAQLGDTSLPTSNTLPVLNPRFAKYADAFHAGYKVAPIHPTAAPDASYPVADKTDLYLTRPRTDYSLFIRSCLVNVNGFYHFSDADTRGIYVKNGMKSAVKSGENNLGILSFRELGTISCLLITPEMVYKQHAEQLFRDYAFIDTQLDLSKKTVMLVLGGYLHVLDKKTFFRVSDSCFGIDFGNLPLIERYYESLKYLDFSSLPIETTLRNPTQIGIENFFSDEVILAYLTLSQSFLVVLDNENVFTEQQFVRHTPLPNMYISYVAPRYPLIVGYGKATNYWYTSEDGQYSLTCHDAFRQNYLLESTGVRKTLSTSAARFPENRATNSHAYFLKIGSDI
jgi:hypothetical protein